METVLKADIFFFVTTIAVVAITFVVIVALYYCIKLMRTLADISALVRDEAELIKNDFDSARDTIKANAEVVGTIIGAVARGGKAKNTKYKK
jgi:hypothetical protein